MFERALDSEELLERPGTLPLGLAIGGVAVVNVAFGSALAAGRIEPVAVLALVPALLVVLAALIASNRAVLVFGALALDLSGVIALREPVVGESIFASDVILVLAVGSWLAAWLIIPGGRRPTWPRTPVLGWPLLVFAIFIGLGVVRGHEQWGLSYFSQPIRFVLYAAIACAMADMTVRQAWRGLTVVFYLGAVVNAVAAVYYLSTGNVQWETGAVVSTGGTRVLTLTTALYLTGSLVLALLNFEREHRIGRRTIHLVVGGLALFGIVIAYGRGVWYALTAVVVVLFLTRPRLRGAALAVLPLWLPALVLGVVLLVEVNPGFFPNVVERVTTIGTQDASIAWRAGATDAIWAQVRENPIIGVGFGKETSFTVNFASFDITQDAHNSFLFLWAGGGIVTLGAFALLFVLFLQDAWRRYRTTQEELPRALIAWCLSIWFCFVANSLVEPQLTQANSLLALWVLMLLPTTVPYPRRPVPGADTSS